jgi:hypothetical protein
MQEADFHTLGHRLRRARLYAGFLELHPFAEITGISLRLLKLWENNDEIMPVNQAKYLSLFFRQEGFPCSPEWLLGLSDEGPDVDVFSSEKTPRDMPKIKEEISWTPGQRLQYARLCIGYSTAKAMAEKYGILPYKWQRWEARNKKFPEKDSNIIVKTFKIEGFFCQAAWFFETSRVSSITKQEENLPEKDPSLNAIPQSSFMDMSFLNDIRWFQKNYTSAVFAIISDDSMIPFFYPGDFVAGIPQSSHQEDDFTGFAIISYGPHTSLVRKVEYLPEIPRYVLIPTNPSKNISSIHPDDVLSFAPIFWHRTVNPKKKK